MESIVKELKNRVLKGYVRIPFQFNKIKFFLHISFSSGNYARWGGPSVKETLSNFSKQIVKQIIHGCIQSIYSLVCVW